MYKKFFVCFHHAADNIKCWEQLADYIGKKTGEKVNLVCLNSYKEEVEIARTEEFDLVFQNPQISFLLAKKGYKPFARLKEQWDTITFIAKKDFNSNKDLLKVGIVPLEILYSTLIELEELGFDMTKISFRYFDNLVAIEKALLDGTIDIGILRKDTYDKKDEVFKNKVVCLKEFEIEIFHVFMMKEKELESEFGQKVQNILFEMHNDNEGKLILKQLETTKIMKLDYKFEFIQRISILGEKVYDLRNYKSFFNVIDNINNVGVLIFDRYIEYANNYAKQLLKLDEKSLESIEVKSLFKKNFINEIENTLDKKLTDKFLNEPYNNIQMISKTGEVIPVLAFISTIIFKGKPTNVLIFTDNRKAFVNEQLNNTLKDLLNIIITAEDIEEVFTSLNEKLHKGMHFDYIKTSLYRGNSLVKEYSVGKPLSKSIFINHDKATIDYKYIDINKHERALIILIPVYTFNDTKAIIEIQISSLSLYLDELIRFCKNLQKTVLFKLNDIEKNNFARFVYSAINSSKDFCFITDDKLKIIYHNKTVSEITGYKPEEIIGSTPSLFKSGKLGYDFYEALNKKLENNEEFSGVFINKTKDGSLFYLDAKILPIIRKNKKKGYIFIGKNITNEVILKTEIEQVKYKDFLTGLYNLTGFFLKSNEYLKENVESVSALILLDVYNMSFINTTYGHEFGNKLLINIANLLEKNMKKRDIIARVSGDDFAILLKNIKRKENIVKITERLISILNRKFVIDDKEVNILVKLSAVLYPDDAKDIKDLYSKAFMTLSLLKKSKDNIHYYNPLIEKEANNYLKIDHLLSKAIEEDLYELHFQPYFYSSDLSIAGFEALIRLKDEDGSLIFPGSFINQLEESIYLSDFEKWLVKKVSEIIIKTGYNISFNISAKNFSKNYLENIFKDIQQHVMEKMIIEITEREVNYNFNLYSEIFNKFKTKTKVKFALDDFGTGFSTLVRLKHLPCDIIKIDLSFIREMFTSDKDTALVNAIIDLGKRFNYVITAEGVENIQQYLYLKNIGCDIVQGYLFSKPVDEQTFLETDWQNLSITLKKKLGNL